MRKFTTILVIDSDPVSNYMSKQFFLKIGLCEKLHIVKNGKEALRFIDLHYLPELILIDLNNPTLNGSDFIEHIKKNGLIDKTTLICYSEKTELQKHPEALNIINKPLTYEKFCLAAGII